MAERRHRFLIDKPLQFHYMITISGTLLVVCGVMLFSLYFGIWGSILDAFSNDKVRNDMFIAARLAEYDAARTSQSANQDVLSPLSLFNQTQKLTERQREIFRDILNQTHQSLIPKLILLLVLISWGSIYLSHKIAGPIYRIQGLLDDVNKGNLRIRMALRKFDEVHGLVKAINGTVENFDSVFIKLKTILSDPSIEPPAQVAQFKEALEKIKTSADPSSF